MTDETIAIWHILNEHGVSPSPTATTLQAGVTRALEGLQSRVDRLAAALEAAGVDPTRLGLCSTCSGRGWTRAGRCQPCDGKGVPHAASVFSPR